MALDRRGEHERREATRRASPKFDLRVNAVDALEDPTCILDAEGRIVDVNEAWRKFGRENGGEGDSIGTDYFEICESSIGADAPIAHDTAQRLRRLLNEGTPVNLVYPCHPPGALRWFELRGVRMYSEGKPYLLLLHLDVTQRQLAEEAAERRRIRQARLTGALQEANRELETFGYSVAHELRASLRGIDILSDILTDDTEIQPEAQSIVERIRNETRRLDSVVEGLLALARVEEAASSAHREEVDLADVARRVVRRHHAINPMREIQLHVPDTLTVNSVPVLLEVLMENLIGNAWKFTSERAPARIEIGEEANRNHRVYYVRDNGQGFPSELAGDVFRPFRKLNKTPEGSGIGLATVARIVHRLGGNVWAESAPGQGATFRFTLHENET